MRYLREWDEMRRTLPLLLLIASLMWLPGPALADLPPGFSKALITGFNSPVGVAFDANGRMYVWERAGRVWLVENGVKSASPLIDISDEVGDWYEHGMLGFALHPNFLSNGWIYLFYAVDHYQLEHGSDPDYDPNTSDTFVASIGRITRYTAQASTGFRTVDPASRRVLLGESPSTGCPLLYNSHGVGSLVFGADDSLLASCGDGASFIGPDTGGSGYGAYTVQALAEGIITPREDVGSFRSQLVSSLAGKLLRLDPLTGDGLPSNPFYDPADPRAARSRVFALGFRNPFRFTLRPGTGSHLKANADPGSIYLGNVGANTWEEIEVVDSPGYNGGWPIYEGMTAEAGFATVTPPANMDAPNPLFGVNGCAKPYFSFADLLIQATLATPSFPNPCDPAQEVPASIPRFVHHRPALAYGRNPGGPMLVPTFLGTLPTFAQVGASGSPTQGTSMGGSTVSGGAWYTGTAFGAAFQNSYFQADLGGAWIVNIRFDANDQPTLVTPFETASPNATVMLATSPKSDALYTVDLFGGVYRITYTPTGNQPPTAVASASPGFGTTPLSVTFNGFGSSDPDGLPLGYSWNFGDGSPLSSSPNPTHTFFGPIGVSTTYPVTLTVTDSGGLMSVAQTVVAVNDTPPQVSITSPATQGMYPMTSSTVYPLTADISDAEQGAGELSCRWQVTLHHNGNLEPLPVDTNCSTTATVDPLGCEGNSYFYTFALTVDDGGLATTREVALYPNCAGLLPAICGNIDANGTRNLADVSRLRTAFARPLTAPLTAGELSRCSVIGDATCDLVDLVVLRRYLAGRAPGIDAVCPAALP